MKIDKNKETIEIYEINKEKSVSDNEQTYETSNIFSDEFSIDDNSTNTDSVKLSTTKEETTGNIDAENLLLAYESELKNPQDTEEDTTQENTYDENGCMYDKNGKLISHKYSDALGEHTIQYTYNNDGNLSEYSIYDENGEIEETNIRTYNDEDKTKYQEDRYVFLSEEGSKKQVKESSTQFVTDANGNLITASSINYDSVTGEITGYSETVFDEFGNTKEITEYQSDHTTIKIQRNLEYDGNGKLKSSQRTDYDENGKKISIGKTEYYANGNTSKSTITNFDKDGNIKLISTTDFNEDGKEKGQFVVEYDKNGNIVCQTTKDYDKDGIPKSSYTVNYNSKGQVYSHEAAEYNENGKIKTNKITDYYKNTITEENYTYDAEGNEQHLYQRVTDSQGNEIFDFQYEFDNENLRWKEIYSPEYDGEIGSIMQGHIGDCWLLAGVNSLSYTEKGRQILNDAITYNADGSFSIYFKGIDTTINLTEEEIEYARESGLYSKGDNDMLVWELAFESALDKIQSGEIQIEGEHPNLTVANSNEEDRSSIEGGFLEDVIYMLTGNDVTYPNNPVLAYMLTPEILENSAVTISFGGKSSDNDICDINGNVVYNTEDLPHAFSVKSIDDDTITIVNPWNSFQEYVIPKYGLPFFAKDIEIYMF